MTDNPKIKSEVASDMQSSINIRQMFAALRSIRRDDLVGMVSVPHDSLSHPAVGKRLREYRVARGYSQAKLAQLSGLSKYKISQMENHPEKAKRGDFHTACRILKISITELVDGDARILSRLPSTRSAKRSSSRQLARRKPR